MSALCWFGLRRDRSASLPLPFAGDLRSTSPPDTPASTPPPRDTSLFTHLHSAYFGVDYQFSHFSLHPGYYYDHFPVSPVSAIELDNGEEMGDPRFCLTWQ